MLAGLPSLKELSYFHNRSSTGGNVNSLRVLKYTLENEKVAIEDCPSVQGNFMELADFPRLKELHLMHTRMTGDIRDIGERDFLALETLTLPKGVYTVERAMSRSAFLMRPMSSVHYSFKQQRPAVLLKNDTGCCRKILQIRTI
ncbi:hypothetical protein QTG54_008490 [Skeletonema marinoi]|uniref:Uncharacterized protein n=1 Tax=Skeletonema marinoi TaxID=267567 RepID=A0AAD8Y785_9STRA|nr:hypothetical protein QTG54_008490 [Skeletonema marinoi]